MFKMLFFICAIMTLCTSCDVDSKEVAASEVAKMFTQGAELCKSKGGNMALPCELTCSKAARQIVEDKSITSKKGVVVGKLMSCQMLLRQVDATSSLINDFQNLQSEVLVNRTTIRFDGSEEMPKLVQAVEQKPIKPIDTNYKNDDGTINREKLFLLAEELAKYCGNELYAHICENNSKSFKSHLQDIFYNFDGMDANNKVSNQNFVNFAKTKTNFIAVLQKSLPDKVLQSPEHKALVSFVDSIKTDQWPPAYVEPELDLDDLIPEAPKIDIVSLIPRVDAIEKVSFDEAKQALLVSSEFEEMKARVARSKYSVAQLKQAVEKLVESKDRFSDSNAWQNKLDEIGTIGREMQLISAIEDECDLNYLSKHKDEFNWKVRLKGYTFNHNELIPLSQSLKPVHLHRLCFIQLSEKLNPMMTNIVSESDINEFQSKYASLPPIDLTQAYTSATGPRRQYQEKYWLPEWAALKQNRLQVIAQQKQADQRNNAEKQRIAKAKAIEDEKKAQMKNVYSAIDTAVKNSEDFFELDYSTLLEQVVYFDYSTNSKVDDIERRASQKKLFDERIDMLYQSYSAHAKFINKLESYANKNYMKGMLGSQITLMQNQGSKRGNTIEQRASETRFDEKVGVTPLMISSCRYASSVLKNLKASTYSKSDLNMTTLDYAMNKCNGLFSSVMLDQKLRKAYQQNVPSFGPKKTGLVSGGINLVRDLGRLQLLRTADALLPKEIKVPKNMQLNPMYINAMRIESEASLISQANQLFTRIVGISAKDMQNEYLANAQARQQSVAALLASTLGKPLPKAPYSFNDTEAYTVLNHIVQNKYLCQFRNTVSEKNEIANKHDFISNLHICGFSSGNEAFKKFAVGYQRAYTQKQ